MAWQHEGSQEVISPPVGGEGKGLCRILVPLDGSALAEDALAAVARLAVCPGIGLILLRVVPPARPVAAEGRIIMTADEVTGLHRREAAEYLAAVAAPLRERGLSAETQVVVGEPAEVILAAAAALDAAAIVMATRGRTGLPRILFGSVTAAVVRAAPVPVLTVHRAAVERPRAAEPEPRSTATSGDLLFRAS